MSSTSTRCRQRDDKNDSDIRRGGVLAGPSDALGCSADKSRNRADTGVDGAYAARTANKAYRTTPLRALWQHPPYFHDGSAATLADVVAHYNRVRKLNLTAEQQRELIEYLKSL